MEYKIPWKDIVRSFSLLFWVTLLLMVSGAQAVEPISLPPLLRKAPSAFAPGERLVYDISYMGVRGGTAVMEVLEKVKMKGRDVYHVVSTAQSNDFVSLFYPVDDRVETYIDVEGLYSHTIKVKQREGKRRREKIIYFDQIQHQAVQLKNNRSEVFEIPPRAQDSLSSLYFFRTQKPVEIGDATFIDVHESEKNWKLEIRALERERVATPVGTFDTIKVQAMVRYEGLFINKGDIFIWFTDDDRRIPVMMRSKVRIGSITAILSSRRDGVDTEGMSLSTAF